MTHKIHLGESIASLLKDHVIGTLSADDYTVIGIPTGRTFSRTFTLPAKEANHVKSALEIEVEQYIPLPMSALYVDYKIVEHAQDVITVIMTAFYHAPSSMRARTCRDRRPDTGHGHPKH